MHSLTLNSVSSMSELVYILMLVHLKVDSEIDENFLQLSNTSIDVSCTSELARVLNFESV